MELGLTELFLGVTGASLLPLALIGGVQSLWRTVLANRNVYWHRISAPFFPSKTL